MYACSLTLARPLTHRPVLERGDATLATMATADAGDPLTELKPPPLSLKLVIKVLNLTVWYIVNKGGKMA